MCNKEIVICAAIWVQDGKKRPYQPTNIPSGSGSFSGSTTTNYGISSGAYAYYEDGQGSGSC